MKSILPIILVLLAVGGAGFAAKTVRGAPEVEDGAHNLEEGGVHDPKKAKKAGDKGDGYGSGNVAYYRFKRDFIVPVMRGNSVDSLVLLRVSVEMDPDKLEVFRPKEPRIRDAFMQTLLSLSHDGLFKGDITAPNVYQTIQSRLTETANANMDDEAKAVLIVDFARQDQ